MKRFLLFGLLVASFCSTAKADFTFDTFGTGPYIPGFPGSGPVTVANGSPVTYSLNDAGNSAGVPEETFQAFRVSADWEAAGGGPWSNEARVEFTFNGITTSLFAPLNGVSNGDATSLSWEYNLGAIYDVASASSFEITMYQTYTGSSANWADIVVEILNDELTVDPPSTDGSLTTGANGVDSLSYAYDASVQNILWTQYDLMADSDSVTFDTEGTTGIDTEIGVYDENGVLLGNNDDGGTGLLSSLTLDDLQAGTYFIATGAYNTTFNDLFAVNSSNTTATGTMLVNVSAFSAVPEPGTLSVLGLAVLGLTVARRRRS